MKVVAIFSENPILSVGQNGHLFKNDGF